MKITNMLAIWLGFHQILLVFFSIFHFIITLSIENYERLVIGIFVGFTSHVMLFTGWKVMFAFKNPFLWLLFFSWGILGWATSLVFIVSLDHTIGFIFMLFALFLPIILFFILFFDFTYEVPSYVSPMAYILNLLKRKITIKKKNE